MPTRIQRKRTKGWRMPENAVYVGRPTRWGNPFSSKFLGTHRALEAYVEDVIGFWQASERYESWIAPLRGRDLACWCALDEPCHADSLLEVAN